MRGTAGGSHEGVQAASRRQDEPAGPGEAYGNGGYPGCRKSFGHLEVDQGSRHPEAGPRGAEPVFRDRARAALTLSSLVPVKNVQQGNASPPALSVHGVPASSVHGVWPVRKGALNSLLKLAFSRSPGISRGTWLAQSVEPVPLDLGVVSSRPILGVEVA